VKAKEPNNPLFSAEESPVPLPSVQDAWADMRKKLDEEMPERPIFWFRKRELILALFLLVSLSLGALWVIEHRGGGEGLRSQHREAVNSNTGSKLGSGRGERVDSREGEQAGSREDKQPGLKEAEQERRSVDPQSGGVGSKEGRDKDPAGGRGEAKDGVAARKMESAKKVIVDSKLAITAAGRDEIRGPKINTKGTTMDQTIRKKDGIVKKPVKTEKPERPSRSDSTRILWAAGLADSKSFPVGAQQPVDYNANLKKDLLFDYIPTPYFQYHPTRTIAVQLAIQFNSPQYTEAVTIFKKPGVNPNVGSPFTLDTLTLVKKLYYFNFPLIVYYTPCKNVYLGAGWQYSNLRNGVAFQNNVIHFTGLGSPVADSVRDSKLVSLKDNRPAYNNLKKSEWRVLFEASYYWKRISLGMQYQEALGDYLHVPVPGSSGKDRNSSFNLYLRYNIREQWIKIKH
jgi:hypothetical protein